MLEQVGLGAARQLALQRAEGLGRPGELQSGLVCLALETVGVTEIVFE